MSRNFVSKSAATERRSDVLPAASTEPEMTIVSRYDPLERDADQVAERVVNGDRTDSVSRATAGIQQTAHTVESAGIAPSAVSTTLRGPGEPLGPLMRDAMESRFAHDFGKVRIHRGSQAESSASAINAKAYTAGEHIVFGRGHYAPDTATGQRLLAHELAHVVQQSGLTHHGDKTPIFRQEDETTGEIVGGTIGAAAGAAAAGARAGAGAAAAAGARAGTAAARAALRRAAESITEIGGTANEADKRVVVDELVKMPLIALSALKTKGIKVVVCRNSVTEIREDLRGVRPRSWPEGTTWDTVPGLNDPANKRVIIATRRGRVPPPGDGHDAFNLVLHEVGHAVGDAVAHGGVDDPDFIAARNADLAALDDYEGNANPAGARETYAESFARFYANDPNDATTYPHLHAYWASNPFVRDTE